MKPDARISVIQSIYDIHGIQELVKHTEILDRAMNILKDRRERWIDLMKKHLPEIYEEYQKVMLLK